jgi:hypothetical protein
VPTRIPFPNKRHAGHVHGDGDRYVYQVVPQTPPLDAGELDGSETVIEIVIVWGGTSVLHVAHLSPPRSFYLGDDAQRDDFLIGADSLGSERMPLVLPSNGELSLVLPRGASGVLERGAERIALEAESAGTRQYPLRRGDCARVQYREFTFIVRSIAAARPELGAVRDKPDMRSSRWTLASASLHALVLCAFYFLPPTSSALSLDSIDTDSRLVKYTIDARENRIEPPKWLEIKPGAAAAGGAEPAAGPRGAAGDPTSKQHNQRMAIKGPPDELERQLSREEQQDLVQRTDLLALLRAGATSLAPSSPYSSAAAKGSDPLNALGNLFGDQLGASFGYNGLGPIGHGRGGGGTADGTLAVGPATTRGPGWGGYAAVGGSFHDRSGHVPRVRSGAVDTRGSLSKETIRRVVNRHVNEVKFCYEQELIAHPDLQGRVSARFMIAPSGAVQTAVITQSDLGNLAAQQCIAKAIARWIFPAPEGGGVVIVNYPFQLSQTGE